MERLNFSIDFKKLNDPDAFEESIDDIKTIIKFLQNVNPNYCLIGDMLDEQLNEQLNTEQLNKQEQTNTGNILPETITKSKLYEKAQERFSAWTKMYASASVTAQQMYEDMSCSVFSGDPAYDFPDEVKKEQDSVIKYQYKDGLCFFMIDGIEVEVQDLRGMRESSRVDKELYADICVLTISYIDKDGMYMYHVVPNTWLYGSTSDEFNEGKPVHQKFIDAARDYIKEHNITKEMQEVSND